MTTINDLPCVYSFSRDVNFMNLTLEQYRNILLQYKAEFPIEFPVM